MSIGGGWVDTLAMRLLDITVPFPFFVLVLAIVAVLGPGIEIYFIALALVGWVGFARLARAEAIVLRSFEFVLAARIMGFSHHAKNHSLLYTGNRSDDRPELAPFYDIVPTNIDSSVVHQLSSDIGAAQMADEITSEDIAAFAADLGYRRVTLALSKRLQKITQAVIDEKPRMSGPALKRIGDVIAEQSRWIAPAVGLQTELPSGDLIVIRRP